MKILGSLALSQYTTMPCEQRRVIENSRHFALHYE